MKCESCGENEAKFHYTKIFNGHIEKKHLCSQCAANDYDLDLDLENNFSMNKFFAGLIEDSVKSFEKKDSLKCEKCGQTYNEFRSEGKFGCDECYVAFKDKLDPLIKGIHGHNHHKGKIPKSSSRDIFLKREKDDLKKALDESIEKEKFEEAAILRDKLKAIDIKLEDIKE